MPSLGLTSFSGRTPDGERVPGAGVAAALGLARGPNGAGPQATEPEGLSGIPAIYPTTPVWSTLISVTCPLTFSWTASRSSSRIHHRRMFVTGASLKASPFGSRT